MKIFYFVLILFSLFFLSLTVLVYFDKNRKRSAGRKFEYLSSRLRGKFREMRAVPRVSVPDELEIFLRFSEEGYRRLKVKVVDLSLSGLKAHFNHRVRRFPDSMSFKDAVIVTPSIKIEVGAMNVTRIESRVKKGIIAFRFKEMDESQFHLLKETISTVKDFSKK